MRIKYIRVSKKGLSMALVFCLLATCVVFQAAPSYAAIGGALVFSGTGQVNAGQVATDNQSINGVTSNDLAGIQLDIFGTNDASYSAAPPNAGSMAFLDATNAGTADGGIFPIDNVGGNSNTVDPPMVLIIKSHNGTDFNFKSFYLSDSTWNMPSIKLYGYRDGSLIGFATLSKGAEESDKIFNNTNGITSSIFQNIDEVWLVNMNVSERAYGIYGGINNIVIEDPPAPTGSYTATEAADTLSPVVGVDNAITLTVKNSANATDTAFTGAKNVTIKGAEAAPDNSYGSFNGTTLDSSSAAGGQTISVTFTNGVATANLKLNKADAQTIGFSIASVATPATNDLTITPTHGTAASMAVTQNITAPASNGGQFAQQPRIAIKDAYGNTCTSDNATVVTAAKEDGGTWTLTGTTTATASAGVATFTNLGATNTALVNNAQLGFTATGLVKVTSTTVTLPAPAGNATATAAANTLTPVVGIDDAITLTVKDSLGNTDTDFDGDKTVTITGYEAAPDATYGSFNGTALEADGSTDVTVTFTNGVATPNLKLNKADGQTIGFSIGTVTTPATNTLTITPTHGTAASMAVTQNITAPASNGGQFAQQPRIAIKDAYGNTCTSDNATVVTAAKEDGGTWTLTGTTTATASAGVATFTNLGATNTALVNNVGIQIYDYLEQETLLIADYMARGLMYYLYNQEIRTI